MATSLKFTMRVEASFDGASIGPAKVRLDFAPEFPIFTGPETPHVTNFNVDSVRTVLNGISTTVLERVMGYLLSQGDTKFIEKMKGPVKGAKSQPEAEDLILKEVKRMLNAKEQRNLTIENAVTAIFWERVPKGSDFFDKVTYSLGGDGTLPPPPPPPPTGLFYPMP